jgi:2-enoate reductase
LYLKQDLQSFAADILKPANLKGEELAAFAMMQQMRSYSPVLVTIVEQLPELMVASETPIPHANRIMLLDLLKFHKVEVLTGYFIAEITDQGVALVSHDFERRRVEADTVGISIGLRPNNKLYRALVGKVLSPYLIGDAREVRNVMGSIWDAYEVARTI